MTDRGLAALAKAIHLLHHHVTIVNGQPSPDFDGEFAAAILGERGVFLPEGLADRDTLDGANALGYREGYRTAQERQAATIATLRGAYREAADWITAVQSHYVLGPEASPEDIFMVAGERQEAEIATLRAALDRIWRANHVVHSASAALATAKEAGDVR
jgi:hypothetical protein